MMKCKNLLFNMQELGICRVQIIPQCLYRTLYLTPILNFADCKPGKSHKGNLAKDHEFSGWIIDHERN